MAEPHTIKVSSSTTEELKHHNSKAPAPGYTTTLHLDRIMVILFFGRALSGPVKFQIFQFPFQQSLLYFWMALKFHRLYFPTERIYLGEKQEGNQLEIHDGGKTTCYLPKGDRGESKLMEG